MANFAIYYSSIGYIHIEHSSRGLTELRILSSKPNDMGRTDELSDEIFSQIERYLRGESHNFDIALDLSRCTPFQRAVYEQLRQIPYGQRCSYKEIATALGNPKASRAVGMANNRNPIHIVIPCHRVVGSNGSLVGYAAGLEIKEQLLRLEDSSR